MTTTTNLQQRLTTAKETQERGEALDQRGAPSSVMGFLSHPGTLKQVARLLGSEEMADRWLRIGLTEVRRIDKLSECTLESFAGALMQCAMLKLEPGPPLGLAWILPYENSVKVGNAWTKRMDAQFQLGYPGIIQLAHRSGQLATIAAHEVCENDEFDFDYMNPERNRHRPPKRGERGEAYGYYCYARFANGGEHFLYMNLDQVLAHAARFSKSYQSAIRNGEKYHRDPTGPWFENRDAMARKTLVRLSRVYLPASADFVQGLRADEALIHADFEAGRLVFDEEAMDLQLGPRTVEGLPEPAADQETGEKPEATAEKVAQAEPKAAEQQQDGLPGVQP